MQRLFDEVFARFDRLDSMMSVWRQGSDILRLNEAAGEHPVQVAPEVFEALTIARRISEWTDGKFDVTFGALSDLWRFDDQDKDSRVPDPAQVKAAAAARRLSRPGAGPSGTDRVPAASRHARSSGRHRERLCGRTGRQACFVSAA